MMIFYDMGKCKAPSKRVTCSYSFQVLFNAVPFVCLWFGREDRGLRALGSLATLSSQRAKIFHVCGRQLLRLMKSPQPMVQRQAKRLLNNLS